MWMSCSCLWLSHQVKVTTGWPTLVIEPEVAPRTSNGRFYSLLCQLVAGCLEKRSTQIQWNRKERTMTEASSPADQKDEESLRSVE